MDKHTEEEIWHLIKSTLESYASQVNARGEKEFTPVYPVMMALGPELIRYAKSFQSQISVCTRERPKNKPENQGLLFVAWFFTKRTEPFVH